MPSHYHTAGTYDNYAIDNTSVVTGAGTQSVIIDISSSTSSSRIKTNTTGSNQAHNNLQPYETDCWIIKAKQSAGIVGNVVNAYSVSTTDAYSCDYINGTILYENASGTNGDIDLADDITNYKKIDVYVTKGNATQNICSFWKLAVSDKFTINANCWAGDPFLQAVYHEYIINTARKLVSSYGGYVNFSGGTVIQGAEYDLRVYKIIGYK